MNTTIRRRLALASVAGSGALYLGCLVLPAFDILSPHADRASYLGLAALGLGAIGHTSSWLANPLLILAWYNLGKGRGFATFLSALVAFLLALTFLRGGQQLPNGSEGMYPYRVLVGYYVWLGAIALAAIAGLVNGSAGSYEPSAVVEDTTDEANDLNSDQGLVLGTCPNCAASIPLRSRECPRCKAIFGSGSTWRVKRL
jgi:hypothetical protein